MVKRGFGVRENLDEFRKERDCCCGGLQMRRFIIILTVF
jgi:hypothetical protein